MRDIHFKRFEPLGYSCTEALNTLCTNLSFVGSDVKKLLLTSCHESEGKSFLTMNIMRTMCKMGKRVVVVDADLRRSVMLSRYGVQGSGEFVGLAHYLAKHLDVDDVLYRTNIPGAYIIPIGRDVANPLSLLNSARFPELLEKLAKMFDLVLVDVPPVGLVIDAAQIAKHCDGAILVVEYGTTRRHDLIDTRKQIEQSGCPIIGCVLNKVTFDSYSAKKYYNRRYYYSHYYQRKESAEDRKARKVIERYDL